jgi:hypothetical protein
MEKQNSARKDENIRDSINDLNLDANNPYFSPDKRSFNKWMDYLREALVKTTNLKVDLTMYDS